MQSSSCQYANVWFARNSISAPAVNKILNHYGDKSRYYSVYTKQAYETEDSSIPSLRVIRPRPKNSLCGLEQGLKDSER
jgi:hypothetical protein